MMPKHTAYHSWSAPRQNPYSNPETSKDTGTPASEFQHSFQSASPSPSPPPPPPPNPSFPLHRPSLSLFAYSTPTPCRNLTGNRRCTCESASLLPSLHVGASSYPPKHFIFSTWRKERSGSFVRSVFNEIDLEGCMIKMQV